MAKKGEIAVNVDMLHDIVCRVEKRSPFHVPRLRK